MTELVWITLALPLVGVVVLTLLGMKLPAKGAGWFASLIMLVAFACAAVSPPPFFWRRASAAFCSFSRSSKTKFSTSATAS